MNRQDIIQMALEATRYANSQTDDKFDFPLIRDEHFASLVAQHELEWCAQLVEPSADHLANPHYYLGGSEGVELLLALAETIRSRGKNVDS